MTETVGEKLNQARSEKGISLDQASKATHIRIHYLEALENDDRAALPSNVQGRGFLRLYAGFLGLPIDPLLDAWEGKPTLKADQQQEQPEILSTSTAEEADYPTAVEKNMRVVLAEETTVEANEDSTAIFTEIGQTLRKQREALGLTLDEVERYTHLRQHYITSLEEGRLENMPSTVQSRGMLSNYATFLNLDEESILLRYAEGLQARRIEKINQDYPPAGRRPKKKPARQAPVWKRFITPDLIFGIGLAVIILFFIIWTAARIGALSNRTAEPTTPPISEILLTPAISDTSSTESPNADGASMTPAGAAQELPTEQTTGNSPLVNTANEPSSPAGTAQPAATVTISAINSDPFQIYIVAKQRVWLRVIADDQVKFQGRVVPGNAYAFSGTKKVELLTGDAAGLQIYFNQVDLGSIGSTGQVVGLIFSQEGIMTPTSEFTPTASPTSASSITPLPTSTPKATPSVTPYVP